MIINLLAQQDRDRDQSLRQVRAAQMETSEVAQAPLDNTALRQVRPAQMETSEATQARLQQVRVTYLPGKDCSQYTIIFVIWVQQEVIISPCS